MSFPFDPLYLYSLLLTYYFIVYYLLLTVLCCARCLRLSALLPAPCLGYQPTNQQTNHETNQPTYHMLSYLHVCYLRRNFVGEKKKDEPIARRSVQQLGVPV